MGNLSTEKAFLESTGFDTMRMPVFYIFRVCPEYLI
jgi:hypothetical protein